MADNQSGGNKVIIGILLLVSFISIAAVSVGGYFLYEKMDSLQTSNSQNTETEKEEETDGEFSETENNNGELGFIKETDEIIVNLNSSKNKRTFLKIKINFELKLPTHDEVFTSYQAVIFDTILSVASIKTKQELMSLGGKEDLKEELINDINSKLPANIVKNIYFRTFVIQ